MLRLLYGVSEVLLARLQPLVIIRLRGLVELVYLNQDVSCLLKQKFQVGKHVLLAETEKHHLRILRTFVRISLILPWKRNLVACK